MGKPSIYRGSTKKERCSNCGRLCYFFIEGQTMRDKCTICKIPQEKGK